jgi:glycosyltransferase involved in cell wall biosynthesis
MSSIKVSIVMAYFNRKEQLIQTIKSINKSMHKNIELVIVDDASESDQATNLFVNNFVRDDIQVNIITIKKEDKTWVNPCIPYNMGFKHATGDIIMIQNPEVMHVGDCITDCVNNLEKGDWITFNCWGSPSFGVNKLLENETNESIIKFLKGAAFNIGGNGVVRNDVGGWLNHYKNHFVAYHYLAAIYKEDLMTKMNEGFREDFKDSVGADDDEFVKRLIYNNFKFKIRELNDNNPACIHLFHERAKQVRQFDWRVNKKIFDKYCINMGIKPENDIELAPYHETPASRQVIYK